MEGVSVIICCYNSAERIEETLDHLRGQEGILSLNWEILIVNNASKDSTRLIVERYIRLASECSIRIVDESIPGLIHARLRGINEARFDYIVFCDDDNHLEKHYVSTAFQILDKNHSIGILGGWNKPKLPFYPGKWIEANYAALAIDRDAKPEGEVNWVFGAGMVIRKTIFTQLKDKKITLMLTGRLGAKQTSGDDAEICIMVKLLRYSIYYSPRLILFHKVDAARLSRWTFIKGNYKNVFSVAYFYILDALIRNSAIKPQKIFWKIFKSSVDNISYFLPRILLGKNNFYSFMMVYQNIQLLIWVWWRRRLLKQTYYQTRENLSRF